MVDLVMFELVIVELFMVQLVPSKTQKWGKKHAAGFVLNRGSFGKRGCFHSKCG